MLSAKESCVYDKDLEIENGVEITVKKVSDLLLEAMSLLTENKPSVKTEIEDKEPETETETETKPEIQEAA